MECLAHTTTIYIAHNVVVVQLLGPVAKSCPTICNPMDCSTPGFQHRNKIKSYDYTVEVMNRFTGLNLIDRVLEELWTKVHDIV